MNFDKRSEATLKIWGTLMTGLVFSMLFTAEKLGVWSLGLAVLIIGAGITTTGFMWNWGDYAKFDVSQMNQAQEMDVEKAKRSRLSLALRDLSDSELANLRQRLAKGDIDEDQLARLLEEESELSKAKRY